MAAHRPMVVLTVIVVLAVAALGQGAPQHTSEAAITVPGGIAAMPAALPGLPPVGAFSGADQIIPAIAPASGPGTVAVVGVFCNNFLATPAVACPDAEGGTVDGLRTVTFTIEREWPEGAPAATFVVNGLTTLKCADGATCDMARVTPSPEGPNGVVWVQVQGGGVNEVIRVTGTDESGDSRVVNIIFVETIFAVPPVSSSVMPRTLAYRCPDVGAEPLWFVPPGQTVATATNFAALLEDMYFYAGAVQFTPMDTEVLYRCGGDTSSPLDDRVYFETDLGTLSIGVAADIADAIQPPVPADALPTLSTSCHVGESVEVRDLGFAGDAGQRCDLDWAPNGVISYDLLGAGDVGVATVTGLQGGGGVLRTINVAFVGPPSSMLFFIGPDLANGDNNPFTVIVIDQDGRPVADEVVDCHTSPAPAPFIVLPSSAPTGSCWTWTCSLDAGEASFDPGLVEATPNIVGGEEFDLTCAVRSDPGVFVTQTVTVPLWWDADGDGCAGGEELSMGFDPFAWHDVYDVPVPAIADPAPNGARDRVVDIRDVLAVLLYAFTEPTGACGDNPNSSGVDYDCDKDGSGAVDGLDYDRSPGAEPSPPWEAGPPDDVVDIRDVLAALAQAFVVDCSEAP